MNRICRHCGSSTTAYSRSPFFSARPMQVRHEVGDDGDVQASDIEARTTMRGLVLAETVLDTLRNDDV